MICRYLRVLLALACLGQVSSALADCWTSVPDGSVLEFNIVGYDSPDPDAFQLLGHFDTYTGTICVSDSPAQDSTMHVSVDVTNVVVQQQQVTALLRGGDFFDAAHWPTATLEATSIEAVDHTSEQTKLLNKSDASFNVKAKLTLRGVSHDVVIPVTLTRIYSKTGKGEVSAVSAILDGAFSIKRLDYGIGQHFWGQTQYLADQVNIHFNVNLRPIADAAEAQTAKIGNR